MTVMKKTENTPRSIASDLLTPLGAYLRLRVESSASFLLESVEHGRLGRYSLVGYGTRVVDFDEAESLGEPVVGYLAYDYVARLEPTVTLPDEGPGDPESRFVVPDTLVRFDHARGIAEIVYGNADETIARLTGPRPEMPKGNGKPRPLRRYPDQTTYESWVRRSKEYIKAGDASRSSSRNGPSDLPRRARSISTGRCGGSTRPSTSSCSSSQTISHWSAPRPRRS